MTSTQPSGRTPNRERTSDRDVEFVYVVTLTYLTPRGAMATSTRMGTVWADLGYDTRKGVIDEAISLVREEIGIEDNASATVQYLYLERNDLV